MVDVYFNERLLIFHFFKALVLACFLFFVFFIVWISGLDRGSEYNFRIAAVTVNGTGPATDWLSAETFESDLDGKNNNWQGWHRLGTNCSQVN